jgi:hypothetical protein
MDKNCMIIENQIKKIKKNLLKIQDKIEFLQAQEQNLEQYIYELECELTNTMINSENELSTEEE